MTTTRRTAICLPAACVGALSACSSTEDSEKETAGARVATSDVPEAGGLIRDGVVVTQPRPGEFKAFDARCPHQGCAVGQVTTEAIICPCHGSHFALADGAVTQGPATTGLTPRTATVDGADVVVS